MSNPETEQQQSPPPDVWQTFITAINVTPAVGYGLVWGIANHPEHCLGKRGAVVAFFEDSNLAPGGLSVSFTFGKVLQGPMLGLDRFSGGKVLELVSGYDLSKQVVLLIADTPADPEQMRIGLAVIDVPPEHRT